MPEDVLILLIVEFCETEYRSEREEEKHGIQEDEPRYAKPADI